MTAGEKCYHPRRFLFQKLREGKGLLTQNLYSFSTAWTSQVHMFVGNLEEDPAVYDFAYV